MSWYACFPPVIAMCGSLSFCMERRRHGIRPRIEQRMGRE
jgi:hypothetical protein